MPVILVFLLGAAMLGLLGLLLRILFVLVVGATALIAHPIQTTLRILQYGCALIGGLALLFALMLWFLEPHNKPLKLISDHAYPYPVGLGIVIGVIIVAGILSAVCGWLADRPTRAERDLMNRLTQPVEHVVHVVHEYPAAAPSDSISELSDRQIVDATVVDTTDTYTDARDHAAHSTNSGITSLS